MNSSLKYFVYDVCDAGWGAERAGAGGREVKKQSRDDDGSYTGYVAEHSVRDPTMSM